MEKNKDIGEKRTLRDFIPLVLGCYGCLALLGLYQHIRLFFAGVLDSFLNKSFLLLLMHHIGFTAVLGLIFAFIFNFLERKKPGLGYRTVQWVFSVILVLEGLLIEYYIQNYEILGFGIASALNSNNAHYSLIPVFLTLPILVLSYYYLSRKLVSIYRPISRMYPFTIILFSIFLATLNSDKKPINENKTQHLIVSTIEHTFEFNTYEGEAEYPLLTSYQAKDVLAPHLNLGTEKPNIVILIVEGLGSDFVGQDPRYPGFTPFLNTLRNDALTWDNFISNTGESTAALPSIIGSLPFGDTGFTNAEGFVNRHTLFAILKRNGYATSFNYGGNTALNHIDRFLDEERVDRVLDKNNFGESYVMQETDAAGISLGYPDKDLFEKGMSLTGFAQSPRLDVYQTLSSRSPYLIPNRKRYEHKLDRLLQETTIGKKEQKIVQNHKEIFASLMYTDEAIRKFLTDYRKRPDYNNTLFLLTGTHNLTDLPHNDELGRYKVPLIIFGPLVKKPKRIKSLASHADIVPSLVSLLDSAYDLKLPQQVAWLGTRLLDSEIFDPTKQISLFRGKNNIQDFIMGPYYLTDNSIYRMDENLQLMNLEDDVVEKQVKLGFSYFKSVNSYVTKANRIIPDGDIIYTPKKTNFSKQDMVWIHSVFNGKDFDQAYASARDLAHAQDWDRALLLCRYILKEIPRHADTEILMGRIYSWQKDYAKSITVLEEAIRKYPTYADGYAALLDTFFWSDQHNRAIDLSIRIKENGIDSDKVESKVLRARKKLGSLEKIERPKMDGPIAENSFVDS